MEFLQAYGFYLIGGAAVATGTLATFPQLVSWIPGALKRTPAVAEDNCAARCAALNLISDHVHALKGEAREAGINAVIDLSPLMFQRAGK
jgi:hypothetical protein